MKRYSLYLEGKFVDVTAYSDGSGTINSALQRETCSCCGQPDCLNGIDSDQEDDVLERLNYNFALDTIESIILAHACQGIDVGSKAYKQGIRTALEAIDNHL